MHACRHGVIQVLTVNVDILNSVEIVIIIRGARLDVDEVT